MSLSTRLLTTLGVSLALLWSATAAWQMWHLRSEVRHTLDQRLAASARMVAGLMSQMPQDVRASIKVPPVPTIVPGKSGIACQVSSIRGEIIARTRRGPSDELGGVPSGFSTQMINGRRWRVYSHVQDGFRVTTADRLSKRHALLENILRAAALPFIIAVIGSMLALWLGVRRGLRPLRRLRHELEQRSPNSLAPLGSKPLPRELNPFVNTLNQLLARIQDALTRERRLTNDTAHELRTPLTAIRTHLQVARLKTGDESQTALDHADTGARRLQHTLEQLLMLARAQHDQAQTNTPSADIQKTVHTAIQDTDRPNRIGVTGALAERRIFVDASLAISALRNLLDNALRFSPHEAMVSIQTEIERGRIVFRIRDHGPGVPAEKRYQLTQRYRRDSSGRGSGLGLAIVTTITERTGGDLWFENPSQGTGLIACLAFPLA